MINICIVAPFDYPIPAIKGGALEQVVENLCVENEKRECLNISHVFLYYYYLVCI